MVQLQADDTGLQLLQGGESVRISFSAVTAAWLVHVGDSFSGPDEYVLVLEAGKTFTPILLEQHSQWLAVQPALQRALECGQLYQADAQRLPSAWHHAWRPEPLACTESAARQ